MSFLNRREWRQKIVCVVSTPGNEILRLEDWDFETSRDYVGRPYTHPKAIIQYIDMAWKHYPMMDLTNQPL